MTKQSVRSYVTDTAGCAQCEHYDDSGVFELCQHPLSTYRLDGREDVHTVQHMREQSAPCGLSRTHFKART